MEIADLKMCSGCGACLAACPQNAIRFWEDAYARRVPEIDEAKCIHCELCVKTCPINQEYFKPKEIHQKCYALQAKEKKYIKGCSSGGIATMISRYIVSVGGYVFGCKFDASMKLEYTECGSMEELEKIKGSKYVQSDLSPCYTQIKKRLEEGASVLVIGVPCQIAGVRGYLKKDYEKLYLLDLICHGTPPVRYLKEHLKRFDQKKIGTVLFRGGEGFVLKVMDVKNKEMYSVHSKEDEYYHAFLNGLTYRDNCYSCPYAATERVSDMTLGDFWGLDKKTLKKEYEGPISVGLVNTSKGERLFEEVKNLLIWEERSLAEALKENEQLNHPVCPDEKDRKTFLKYYPTLGYDGAMRRTNLYKKEILGFKCKAYIKRTSVGQILQKLRDKTK